jgi:hypothetical protein
LVTAGEGAAAVGDAAHGAEGIADEILSGGGADLAERAACVKVGA